MKTEKLTVAELAAKLEVSEGTVRRMYKAERIPCIEHLLGFGRGRPVYFNWPAVKRALGIK